MTEAERQKAGDDFKALWESMGHSTFNEAYQEWREAPAPANASSEVCPSMPSWGGDCQAMPITKHGLHRYITQRDGGVGHIHL